MDVAVVDTDVLSYLFKGDSRGEWYRPQLAGALRVVSFMTLAELDRWALKAKWGKTRKSELATYLAAFEVYYPDRDVCLCWASATDSAARKGRSIACADAWIAATALALDVPLVTNNPKDYAGVQGLTVLSAG